MEYSQVVDRGLRPHPIPARFPYTYYWEVVDRLKLSKIINPTSKHF